MTKQYYDKALNLMSSSETNVRFIHLALTVILLVFITALYGPGSVSQCSTNGIGAEAGVHDGHG